MNQNLSSSQLKSLSKGQLLGKYTTAISAEAAAGSLLLAVSFLCSSFTDQSSLSGMILSGLISLLVDVLNGIFLVGLSRFYLNLISGRPFAAADIFYGFRTHADRAIAVRFILCILELICMLPALFCIFFFFQKSSAPLFLCFSIFAVMGGCAIVYFRLTFSQVYYIMLDFPSYTFRQIMRTSRNIMKGNKGRLFYITVTLIPYYLACFLSCGIALLWVLPYQKTIYANFYLDLMRQD